MQMTSHCWTVLCRPTLHEWVTHFERKLLLNGADDLNERKEYSTIAHCLVISQVPLRGYKFDTFAVRNSGGISRLHLTGHGYTEVLVASTDTMRRDFGIPSTVRLSLRVERALFWLT